MGWGEHEIGGLDSEIVDQGGGRGCVGLSVWGLHQSRLCSHLGVASEVLCMCPQSFPQPQVCHSHTHEGLCQGPTVILILQPVCALVALSPQDD